MISLEGKVAIVTGGTRGIGLETVKTFKENGASVILFGSKKESVVSVLQKLKNSGLEVEGYYPNLLDNKEIEETIKKIRGKYGHIDILVNNAGMSANKKIEDTTSEEFKSIIDLNVNAIFNVTKAVTTVMKEQKIGVILNTKWVDELRTVPSI